MISEQYSGVAQLFKNIFSESNPQQKTNMTKNSVYSIPCRCGKIYEGETC